METTRRSARLIWLTLLIEVAVAASFASIQLRAQHVGGTIGKGLGERLCLELNARWRNQRIDSALIDRVRVLLDGGADPNCDCSRRSPLALAAWTREPRLVRLLLKRGADVDARDKLGRTPLLQAYVGALPDSAVVQALLDAGSDVRVADSVGGTILHHILSDRWLEVTRPIIEAGADVNAENILGDTPLCNVLELKVGNEGMLELLRAAGARECPFDTLGNPAKLLTLDRDSTSWTGVRMPCDIDDAIASLDAMFHPRFKAMIGIAPEDVLAGMHLGFGMWLRNEWGLWGDGPLACWFQTLGVYHPDDMSSLVLRVYRRNLRGEAWHLATEIEEAREGERKMQAQTDR